MVKKHKLAVIGYGGMGGWHTRHALASDVVELAGIYDIDEKKRELAKANGIHAYETIDELWADKDVELVTIATPNDVHRQIAIDAMANGKNVISEKPVTISVEDLIAMIDASKKYEKLFTVHQNRRWDVDYLAMKQIQQSGELGKILNIESRIHGSRGIPSDWRGIKKYGGGMLYDWGIHLIDQMLQIFTQKIVSVHCDFDHITNKEVDDGFKLTLYFEDGAQTFIEVGTYNFIAMPRFYMRGEKGSAIITDWTQKCKVTKCKAWHESDVVPVQTAAGLTKTMAPRDEITTEVYELEKPSSDVHDYYRNICGALEGTQTQLVTHEQMLRVMKVIEAAFESAEKHQVIPFEE